MTQRKNEVERIAELNALFMSLDNRGQNSALTILRSLEFAQSVMCMTEPTEQHRKRNQNNKDI